VERSEAGLVRLCAWSGVVFIVLFAVGWGVLGQNIPPYAPDVPADQLAATYRADRNTLRIGFALGAFSCAFMVPWVIGIFRVMLAIEPGKLVLPYLQLAGGLLTVPVPMFACIAWLAAAFRPEQDPGLTRMLFDLGWLTIDIGFGVTILQYVALGVAALRDPRDRPLFPTWLGWLGIAIGLEFLIELIMPYFRSGPFSWSGVFAYWIPFFGPFVWMLLVVAYLLKAAPRLVEERPARPEPVAA
jgi:hypothetical protein